MKPNVDRRRFLQVSSLAVAGAAAPALLSEPHRAVGAESERWVKKAVGYAMIQEGASVEDKLRVAKDAGFEGIEYTRRSRKEDAPEPAVLARASEKIGIPIHGVTNSSGPDLKAAIDEAVLYGASSVLIVVRPPTKERFLEHYQSTQEAIRSAIPHAEKQKIHILIENVWATFLIEPLTMARYIDELNSPFVKAYFDVGNVLRWGWPEHWIEVLGSRIVKIHIKEYNVKVAMNEGMVKGFDFPIGEGSIDWKRVCAELKKVGFRGWATAEVTGGDLKRLAEISRQMDRVLSL